MPPSCAAGNGHRVVVKILPELNEVNPNTADTKNAQTPLLWAAASGHMEVVEKLRE